VGKIGPENHEKTCEKWPGSWTTEKKGGKAYTRERDRVPRRTRQCERNKSCRIEDMRGKGLIIPKVEKKKRKKAKGEEEVLL